MAQRVTQTITDAYIARFGEDKLIKSDKQFFSEVKAKVLQRSKSSTKRLIVAAVAIGAGFLLLK